MTAAPETLVTLGPDRPVWERCFTVSPLVVVGTREGEGWNLAPKHMVTPLGWEGHFGFVCTPEHATYHNAREEGAFTVSFPRPGGVVVASLTATPRCGGDGEKPVLDDIPTFPARELEGILLEDAHLWLECELDRTVDGFGSASLVAGRVVAAHAREESMRVSGGDDQERIRRHPLLAYVSPDRWAEIRETDSFPFPEGFRR